MKRCVGMAEPSARVPSTAPHKLMFSVTRAPYKYRRLKIGFCRQAEFLADPLLGGAFDFCS
jgi:hypothetical protein